MDNPWHKKAIERLRSQIDRVWADAMKNHFCALKLISCASTGGSAASLHTNRARLDAMFRLCRRVYVPELHGEARFILDDLVIEFPNSGGRISFVMAPAQPMEFLQFDPEIIEEDTPFHYEWDGGPLPDSPE